MQATAGALAASAQAQTGGLDRLLAIPGPGRVRAVLDTDTYNEIDDQYAVAYSLLSPERLSIEAIYAAPFVNDRSPSAAVGMEKSYEEILRLLGFFARCRIREACSVAQANSWSGRGGRLRVMPRAT